MNEQMERPRRHRKMFTGIVSHGEDMAAFQSIYYSKKNMTLVGLSNHCVCAGAGAFV